MKTKRLLATASLALALSTLNPHLSTCRAQGSLTPPGPPAPTMKTLDQVEPRTAITNTGAVTISQPGSYYLTANLAVSSGDAITIATNGVTLDLNGFTISSTASPAAGVGILLNSGLRDITIGNGHIRGGVTNNAGVFNGPGFLSGIHYSGTAPINTRVSGVSVSGCLTHGIYLHYTSNATLVESCTVQTVGGTGIRASTITRSVALDCGANAIYGLQVSDCRGESAVSGYGVYASTASNCYGSGSNGIGVSATIAQNCYGLSSGGTSALFAQNASFCTGYRSGGRAIEATIANGCYAASGTNLITYKYNMP